MPAKILLAGEGGQGVQSIAKIIAIAAEQSGKKVSYLPSFGVEQRGGVSLAYVQISSEEIAYPRFSKASIVVAFSNRSIESISNFINDRSMIIYDNSAITSKNLEKIKNDVTNYIGISAEKIAKEKYTSKNANMMLLGAISTQIKDISIAEFEKVIKKEFEKKAQKNPEINEMNINAFKDGIEIAQEFDRASSPFVGSDVKEIERNFEKGGITWRRFPEYCKGCSLCIVRCPVKALQFSKDSNFLGSQMPIVDMDKCIGCKKCMQICPDGAIRVEKTD